MTTIGWRDVACTELTGPIEVDALTFHIAPEHLALWRDDPDGRFKLETDGKPEGHAILGKFYPSL